MAKMVTGKHISKSKLIEDTQPIVVEKIVEVIKEVKVIDITKTIELQKQVDSLKLRLRIYNICVICAIVAIGLLIGGLNG